jgi:acylphosphatase
VTTQNKSGRARLHLIVDGRVQGVGFRFSTYDKAKEFALAGWVSNLGSGEVEIVAEGKQENLQMLAAWARQGPRFYWGIYRLPDSLIGGWKRWPFNGWPGLAMLQIRVLEYLQSFGISELYFYQALTTRRLD